MIFAQKCAISNIYLVAVIKRFSIIHLLNLFQFTVVNNNQPKMGEH